MVTENKSEKWIIIAGVIFVILLIAVLVIIKANSTTFTWKQFAWGTLGIIVFIGAIIVIYHFFIKDRLISPQEKLNKLPEPITLEEAREMAKNAMNNRLHGEYLTNCRNESIGLYGKGIKSHIYYAEWDGYYSNDLIVTMINLHNPKNMRACLVNPKPYKISQVIQRLADNSEELSEFSTVVEESPLTGIRRTVITPKKKIEEKKKEKVDELDEKKEGDENEK